MPYIPPAIGAVCFSKLKKMKNKIQLLNYVYPVAGGICHNDRGKILPIVRDHTAEKNVNR